VVCSSSEGPGPYLIGVRAAVGVSGTRLEGGSSLRTYENQRYDSRYDRFGGVKRARTELKNFFEVPDSSGPTRSGHFTQPDAVEVARQGHFNALSFDDGGIKDSFRL
jgi:hypothetical protein